MVENDVFIPDGHAGTLDVADRTNDVALGGIAFCVIVPADHEDAGVMTLRLEHQQVKNEEIVVVFG